MRACVTSNDRLPRCCSTTRVGLCSASATALRPSFPSSSGGELESQQILGATLAPARLGVKIPWTATEQKPGRKHAKMG